MKSNTSSPRRPTAQQRLARGERQRKWFFVSLVFTQAQVVALVVLVLVLFSGRAESRRYYNDQIKMLVCSVPPGETTRDLLREQAGCGPYVAPAQRPGGPGSAARPSPSSTRTVTGEARITPPTAATTRPARTTATAQAPAPHQTATTTVRRVAPAPRPPARSAPSTPQPTSATTGLLPGLLCTLLGCTP